MNVEDVKKMLSKSVKYHISMEVEGSFAMFARGDTGSEKTTYEVIPFGPSKGIFESILYMPNVFVVPYKTEICSSIEYQSYAFNYRGYLRKSILIKNDNSCQIRCTILRNVIYRLYAFAISDKTYENDLKINQAHSYQAQFNKRLVKGRNYRQPNLGWSEFLCSYYGVFRQSTKVQTHLNFTIPSLLFSCFDRLNKGSYSPSFLTSVEVKEGVVYYVK